MTYSKWFRKHVKALVELWTEFEEETGEEMEFSSFCLALYTETTHNKGEESE